MDEIHFDLKQLQTFIAVVETGSFTAAAQKLMQTQSSVSQQIASLEKGFHTQLLNRAKRPVQLTMTGEELYQFGTKLIKEGKFLQEKIYAIEEGQISSLKLGIVDSIGQAIGLEVLKLLHPKVKKISQITGTAPDLLEALVKGKINLALTMMHTDMPSSVQVYPLMLEEYLIVSPSSWPPTGSQTLNWLKWRKLQPHIQFEIARADDILKLIASGYGWTLATPLFLTLAPALLSHLRFSALPLPGLTRKLVLICKDGEFNDFCKTFALEVKSSLLTMLQGNIYHLHPADTA